MASRANLLSEFQIQYPWMPRDLANVWVDAFIEEGDPNLAWQEVRNGEGKQVYDQTFPGNRREDGTLRLNESQYMSTVAQYRNTLAQRGLDPSAFDARFSTLLENEVSAQEFEQRVSAIQENIIQRSEEIQQAFAEAAGLDPESFTPEAALATVLDPDGVGKELLERRIGIAQVRGTAAEFGFQRSQERVEELIARADIGEQQARQFFAQAQSQLDLFRGIEARARGERTLGVSDLEDAALLSEQEDIDNLSRLLSRERALFSSQRRQIAQTQSGALRGLGTP